MLIRAAFGELAPWVPARRRSDRFRLAAFVVVLVAGAGFAVSCGPESTALGKAELPRFVVQGHIVDAADKAIGGARVVVSKTVDGPASAVVEVSADGTYRFETDEEGFANLSFQAVDHDELSVQTWLEAEETAEFQLDVCLGDYRFAENPKRVAVFGDFNDFDAWTSKLMTKNDDGSWSLVLETDRNEVAYQIVGLGDSYHGNNNDNVRYLSDQGWVGVVSAVDGQAEIRLDAPTAAPMECGESFRMAPEEAGPARIAHALAKFQNEFDSVLRDISQKAKADDYNPEDGAGLYEKAREERLDPLFLRLREEHPEPAHRTLLDVTYFTWSAGRLKHELAAEVFRRFEPTTAELALHSSIAMRLVSYGVETWGEEAREFLDAALAEHPNATFRANILEHMVGRAKFQGDEELAEQRTVQLLAEYPDSEAAENVRKRFGDLSALPVGSNAPEFTVAGLFDPEARITNETMAGRPYLVDFWATWCLPCIKEIPNLNKAYERYASQGLEILSIALDGDPQKAIDFVRGRDDMPWLHGADAQGTLGETAQAFEVRGIPAPYLISSDGTVVAKGFELREDNLERHIGSLLAVKD